ncbi:MAG: pyocin knob domain-containing S74 family peptidase [Shinella sp.]|nr:pyocin knob domain-containing S74 family peptidase [Shinella sp.]
MALQSDYTAGTITIAANGTAVTGTGTGWLTAGFQVGDLLFANGWVGVVLSVNSNTSLTLAQPWRGGALNGAPYRLRYQSDGSRFSAQARALINLLGGSGNFEAFAGLVGAANRVPIFTGVGTMSAVDRATMLDTVLGLGSPGTKGIDLLQSTTTLNALSRLGPVLGGSIPVPSGAGVGLADGDFNSINIPGVYTIASNWINGPLGAASTGYAAIMVVLARSFSNGYVQIVHLNGGEVWKRHTSESGGTAWPNAWERIPRTVSANTWSQSQMIDGGTSSMSWQVTRSDAQAGLGVVISGEGLVGQVGSITNHPFIFRTNTAERMRISEGGQVTIGTTVPITTTSGTNTGHYFEAGGRYHRRSNGYQPFIQSRLNTAGACQEFYFDYTQVGTIGVNSTATSYNTSSDYRLKENVEPLISFTLTAEQFDLLDDCLLRVMTYRPVSYSWISTGELSRGFIAHELQQVAPHAVAGEKDEMRNVGTITIPEHTVEVEDPETGGLVERIVPVQEIAKSYEGDLASYREGSTWEKTHEEPVYQGVDTSKLVADLTAALQSLTVLMLEQAAAIEGLKARVAAIEAAG